MKLPIIGVERLRMATDGEGVTTLVGTYGCPLQCSKCINPHAWKTTKYVKWVTLEQLFDKVKMDRLYFEATGGGLTFGGGEPLLHMEFIQRFKEQYGEGMRFTLETSLNVREELVHQSLGVIDSYIIDIKDWNSDIYKCYTGQDNCRVKSNLVYLLQRVSEPERLQVKIPLIEGYNTELEIQNSEDALRQLGIQNSKVIRYL